MNETRLIFMFATLATLFLSGYSIVVSNSADVSQKGPPVDAMAMVHVNVMYPDGGPARHIYLRLHRYDIDYAYYYSEKGMTNSTGKDLLEVTYRNLGPCYLTLFNSSKSSFSRIPLKIWPGDEKFLDVVLEPSLSDYNTISGRVYNGSTGSPTPSFAKVIISGIDERGKGFERENTTTKEGEYSLSFPNSTTPLEIRAEVNDPESDFLDYNSQISRLKGKEKYDLDIHLTRDIEEEVGVNLRFLNSTSGRIVDRSDIIRITGARAYQDHRDGGVSYIFTGNDGGWRNVTLGKGEYIFSWEHIFPEPNNTLMRSEIPVIDRKSVV